MNTILENLALRLEDECRSSKLLALIDELAATRDPAAIDLLATLLDTPGPVGRAVVDALIRFGAIVVPAMRKCIDTGVDEDAIRNAHRVLAALGDPVSAEAQYAECWADFESGESNTFLTVLSLLREFVAA